MLMTDCLTNIGGETATPFGEEEEEGAEKKNNRGTWVMCKRKREKKGLKTEGVRGQKKTPNLYPIRGM